MRVEFSPRTKEVMAKRAGYRCSFPNCRRLTVGPGRERDKPSETGFACHIYSASPDGPRGQGDLSPEELSSLANGIWLCGVHQKLVDNNKGSDYPPSLLLSYRDLHEAWIAREHGDSVSPFGWIQELNVIESPIMEPGSKVRLGRVTLVEGGNGVGKTALCEWLAGSAEPGYLDRWRHSPKLIQRHTITYFSDARHEVQIEASKNRVRYVVDGVDAPFNPISFRTVLLTDYMQTHQDATDLGRLAAYLGESPSIAVNLAELIPKTGTGYYSEVLVDGKTGEFTVRTTKGSGYEYRPWSHSEEMRLAVELAIVKAQHLAQYFPTILMLDAALMVLDLTTMSALLQFLGASRGYQTVLMTIPRRDRLDWDGWEQVRIIGHPPNASIEQGLIGGLHSELKIALADCLGPRLNST